MKKKNQTLIEADKVVIATGSEPVSLPGIEIDEKMIVSSTGALKLEQVPPLQYLFLETGKNGNTELVVQTLLAAVAQMMLVQETLISVVSN